MNAKTILLTLAAIVAAALAYTVWPTPYRYDHVEDRTANRRKMLMRTHRITGAVEELNIRTGWERITPDFAQ